MATTVPTFALNQYPTGLEKTQEKLHCYGVVTIPGGGTYVTGGLPIVFADPNIQCSNMNPFFGELVSPTSGLSYVFDSVHQTIRIFPTYGTEAANSASVAADSLEAHLVFNMDT